MNTYINKQTSKSKRKGMLCSLIELYFLPLLSPLLPSLLLRQGGDKAEGVWKKEGYLPSLPTNCSEVARAVCWEESVMSLFRRETTAAAAEAAVSVSVAVSEYRSVGIKSGLSGEREGEGDTAALSAPPPLESEK
jgi:hypothetical protein